MIRQSTNEFYVCVRLRATDTLVARLPAGTGSFTRKSVIRGLMDAVDDFGPDYKVVIEPVEYERADE